jgi:DNA mismatch endonuclease (patch repair protein)
MVKSPRHPQDALERTLAGQPIDSMRSVLMGSVGARNSKPEMVVRRLVHALGYRFRLHLRNLPGTPDLVFPRLRKVIFVHGCFWHRHPGCRRSTSPKTRAEFWATKFERNTERDARKEDELKALGWEVLIVWECETFDADALAPRLAAFLAEGTRSAPKMTLCGLSPLAKCSRGDGSAVNGEPCVSPHEASSITTGRRGGR